jgi:thymus-specific serine protease
MCAPVGVCFYFCLVAASLAMTILSYAAALLASANLALSFTIPNQGLFLVSLHNSHPPGKLMYDSLPSTSYTNTPFDYYMEQQLDHFDRSNNATFSQRYFVNTTYWSGPDTNAPVFLCVGGEGPPLDYLVLVSSVHCNDMVELAPKHGALLLALEHRYYGPSTPNDDLSSENLIYLNSEQALGDIASFHSHISQEYGLTSSNRWVSWGGSYPGMMAAMARLRYPHLFHASVSSSSPLRAEVEMEEYNEVVASAMAAEDVGGSQACLDIIKEGHASIGSLLTTSEGRRGLEETFNVCGKQSLEDPQNQIMFAGYGVVYLPAQSNDPACTTNLCNIEKVCSYLTETATGDSLSRLAQLSAEQSGGVCKSVNYQLMINFYANPKNPSRSWLYQTCTEWGFYQTCPVGSGCPYTQVIALHSHHPCSLDPSLPLTGSAHSRDGL